MELLSGENILIASLIVALTRLSFAYLHNRKSRNTTTTVVPSTGQINLQQRNAAMGGLLKLK